ncbi:4Fe-4S dicluster domain-containing protein [bacterium]|nr:4Fe-4S dicluster domain-containing protein [bacterium]MBU1024697.1 4Fe-4S dicluster domain-containing protein [bacterium]
MDRRDFFKTLAVTTGAILVTPQIAHAGTHQKEIKDSWMGCLVDLTLCNGCRKCEWACAKANERNFNPLETYEDKTVFKDYRRFTNHEYTVVNRIKNVGGYGTTVYVKSQCFQCNDPACVSACLVGAFSKEDNGTVLYDPWKCMGCRYCMVACPFQIPTYEYFNALTPQVRKCTFCHHKISEEGGVTACAKECPVEAITYHNRKDLIRIAKNKIRRYPTKYINHIYGETEVGGTSWLYISGVPFEQLGFPTLTDQPMPSFTEPIQHGIFNHFIPQIALFAFLAAAMYQYRGKNGDSGE